MEICNVTFSCFEEEVKDKRIICIGVGKLFYRMLEICDSKLISRIDKVFDNHKAGEEVAILDRTFTVEDVEAIKDYSSLNAVILVMSMYAKDIIEQLNGILDSTWKDVKTYIYPIMSLKSDLPEYSKTNKSSHIPKTIHYIWFGNGTVPLEAQKYIESWKYYCPDYEIILWNENNYDVQKSKYTKWAYENRLFSFVADYARVDIIYDHGGFYLDTDVELIKSLDSIRSEKGYAGFQRNFSVNFGLGFGGTRHLDVFRLIREQYEELPLNTFELQGGPILETKVLSELGLKCNNNIQSVAGLTIFPTEFFDPKGYAYGSVMTTQNTYSIHHYNESWLNEKSKQISKEWAEQLNQFRNV